MHRKANALHIPADRIAVAGESGGGALCAALRLLARDRGDAPLSAQFLMLPMLDDRTGTMADPTPMRMSAGAKLGQSAPRERGALAA
jgi:acetyl esterase/lipase